jgi:segregation and condensation protein A
VVDEIQIPEGAAFRIQLGAFEGPLDLLLHLIKKHELNILDLPIAFVTEKYLDYLQMMQELDLDVASEYLLMAATLAHIKSKMLLPQNPLEEVEEQDDGYVADPRAELIRRLLEYQKYRAAAEQLGARPIAGRDVFGRGSRTEEAQGQAPLAQIDLYKLLDAFGAILKRVKGRVALEVTAEEITIGERISQLSELLQKKRSCVFEELFAKDRTRYEVVVTFLALLEMTKLRITRIYQADPASPLHVQYALLDADAPAVAPEEVAAAYASQPVDLEAKTGEAPVESESPEELAAAEFEHDASGQDDVLAAAEFDHEAGEDEEVAAAEFGHEAHEPLDETTAFGGLHATDEEPALRSFGADSEPPSPASYSDEEPREPVAISESEIEPEADEAGESKSGLDYDALQPDASPVDAMAGIFDAPEVLVESGDAVDAPLEDAEDVDGEASVESILEAQDPVEAPATAGTQPEPEATDVGEAGEDEEPASDRETPV